MSIEARQSSTTLAIGTRVSIAKKQPSRGMSVVVVKSVVNERQLHRQQMNKKECQAERVWQEEQPRLRNELQGTQYILCASADKG